MRIASKSGTISVPSTAGSVVQVPFRALAYSTGKSSWSDVVASSRKRSCVRLTTSAMRAFSRSILLMTTMGFSPFSKACLQHEPGLRHGAFHRVHQQQAAVGHIDNALDLAAEIGMARRIDDIDLHAPVHDGGILGQDGYAFLALQRIAVHDQLAHLLVLAENLALLEQGIHQAGLAVVYMRDNSNISYVFTELLQSNPLDGLCV